MRDDGQMMLLGAIVLVIALWSVAGIATRVPDLQEAANQEANDPLLAGASQLSDGVAALAAETGCASAGQRAELENALPFLAHLEASAGRTARFTLGTYSAPNLPVQIEVADGVSSLVFTKTLTC